jgi:hypothetical protein
MGAVKWVYKYKHVLQDLKAKPHDFIEVCSQLK